MHTRVLGVLPGCTKLALALAAFAAATLGAIDTAQADPISVCTGAGCSTTNVTGTIVAGNGTVTISLTNNLTNSQVVSVIQNVSAVYFGVTGYNLGDVSLAASNSTQSTNVGSGGTASLAGAVNPTGWAAGHNSGMITVCGVCAWGVGPSVGPELTIIGGTGSGVYANANGSIANNAPHNPFLAGTVTFSLVVPGVTVSSTFNNVMIQFGTTATPPTVTPPPPDDRDVPEPTSLVLLGSGLMGVAALRRRRR